MMQLHHTCFFSGSMWGFQLSDPQSSQSCHHKSANHFQCRSGGAEQPTELNPLHQTTKSQSQRADDDAPHTPTPRTACCRGNSKGSTLIGLMSLAMGVSFHSWVEGLITKRDQELGWHWCGTAGRGLNRDGLPVSYPTNHMKWWNLWFLQGAHLLLPHRNRLHGHDGCSSDFYYYCTNIESFIISSQKYFHTL